MLGSDLGEHLAVQLDAFFVQYADESAVGEAVRTDGGVETDVPERPEIGLLVFTVRERVLAGVHIGLPCRAFFLGTVMTITLRLFEKTAAELQGVYCFLYA